MPGSIYPGQGYPGQYAALADSAIHATLAVTEADDTLVAAVAVLVTASASITEAADGLASTVAVLVKADAAITEAADTVTASAAVAVGVIGISGSIGFEPDIDEDPDTVAAAAAVLVTATAAITEENDALSASASGPAVVAPATVGGGGVRVSRSQWVVPGLRRPIVPEFVHASAQIVEEDDAVRCSVSVIYPPRSMAQHTREFLKLAA